MCWQLDESDEIGLNQMRSDQIRLVLFTVQSNSTCLPTNLYTCCPSISSKPLPLSSFTIITYRILREAKIQQRLDLFEVLRSADCQRVKAFIGDTLEPVKNTKQNQLTVSVQRAIVMRELIASQPLLHCCVGEPSSRAVDNEQSKTLAEGRVAIAHYLLSLKHYPISLGVTDDDGRTALHLAAKKEDSHMLKLLLTAREESAERKSQLDINARCGKSGWTILHYAAGQGDVTSVRLLMEVGAAVVIHATVGKAVTPLDIVKTRLQNAGHFSATHIANLQQVARELSEAVRALEKIKAQKEAERLQKEELLEAARKKVAEREEKERELLERKQKQLKDKQDRAREMEEEIARKSPKGNAASSSATGKDKDKDKGGPTVNNSVSGGPTASGSGSGSNSGGGGASSGSGSSTVNLSGPLSSSTAVSSDVVDGDSTTKSAKKKKKKDKKQEEEEVQPIPLFPPPSGSGKVTVVDVASRDELVDHLLAMGFAECDCLSAISLYGKDLDRALSWLCDRPAKVTEDSNSKTTVTSSAKNNNSGSGSGSVTADSLTSSQAEGIRLQKEKDHKEELRRVNRAWNLKNEDEKKRVRIFTVFCKLFELLLTRLIASFNVVHVSRAHFFVRNLLIFVVSY